MHDTQSDLALVALFVRGARILGLAVAVIGVLVLLGWLLDVAALKSVYAGWATMKPNTALGFLMGGAALFAAAIKPVAPRWHQVQSVFAVLLALLGLLTVGEYLFALDLGIDQLLFFDPAMPGEDTSPGRMAHATAAAFVATGLALLLLDRGRRCYQVAQLAALIGMLIGLLALLGYAYDVASLYGVAAYSSVALHTAICLMLLNVGVLFSRPEQGQMALVTSNSSGGVIARRLLLFAVIGPFLIGWLHFEAEKRNYVSYGFGIAVVSLTYVVLLSTLVLRTAAILRASDQKLHHLYQLSPVGIVLTDMQGAYLESNQAFQQIGTLMPNSNMLFGGGAVQQHAALERSGVYGPDEKEFIGNDGHPIFVRFNGALFKGADGKKYVWSIVEDITERKHAEKQRQKNDASSLAQTLFTQQLLEQLPIGVALRKLAGEFIDINPAFAAILGRTREQVIGMSNAQTTPPEYATQDAAQTQILNATGSYGPYEKEYLLADGSLVPVQVHGRHVEINGETLILSVVEDISARRKSEFQLAQAQKMDAIGQLTGGLAHDFNNMLGVIIGNLDLLAVSLAGNAAAQARLDTALTAALGGADLTRALLSVARAQATVSEPVDLNRRLNELLPLIRHTAGSSITVDMAFADGPIVQVDSGGLASTLLNLVLNARDAMPDGGRLTVTTRVRSVVVADARTTLAPGQYAALSVTDTGSGMSADVVASAMLPFFTTKERGRGTGLGLAMAHGFVKQCGGELLLYSELGHGTTVTLMLPIAGSAQYGAAGAATDTAPPDLPALARGSERLLLVDDEIELLAVAAQWLKALGYEVTPCSTPASALAALRDAAAAGRPYALMITDIIMPGMDGFALAIAARAIAPALALLYVSGFADAAERGRQRPAGQILEKPFRQPALASMVRKTLDRI